MCEMFVFLVPAFAMTRISRPKESSIFSDFKAYHEQMGPVRCSNGNLDIALSNAHT